LENIVGWNDEQRQRNLQKIIRMKRSGAWSVEETGNEMLRIRCAIYNGTYDKVFERYKQANSPKTTNSY
jgi:hypothetical protein